MIEKYFNEKESSDDEIYRKIRDYHFQENLYFK